MSRTFDLVLKELRRLGKSAGALADSLEAIEEAGEEPAPPAGMTSGEIVGFGGGGHDSRAEVPGSPPAATPRDEREKAEGSRLAEGGPRVGLRPPEDDRVREWLNELLGAAAECLVKGDGFGPNSYRILPPTPQALEKLEIVRARVAAQMEEAGLA